MKSFLKILLMCFLSLQTTVPFAAVKQIHNVTVGIEIDGSVSFAITNGELRPQIIMLLSNHPRLKDTNHIIWSAPDADIELNLNVTGKTLDELISNVLSYGKLKIIYYPNGYFEVLENL